MGLKSSKMLELEHLLSELGYDRSPHYRRYESDFEPQTVHLLRTAREIKVEGAIDGIYVFTTSPDGPNGVLPAQPVVYIARAETESAAREIHRSLWNMCYAPFLIVTLPHQIRIYTGFNYSAESDREGLLEEIDSRRRLHILKHFAALAIDSRQIWQSPYARDLNPNQRVDKRLLESLGQLSHWLKQDNLSPEVAHALIGKYVYFSYLRDRNILSDEWLKQRGISPQSVFSAHATVASLRRLSEVLEDRFNGRIFPIDFDVDHALSDSHVSLVASVFLGDKITGMSHQGMPNDVVKQLHLPFRAFNFNFIPVETLSSIYEQFIYDRKSTGAIYTPEVVADYLLSEVECVREFRRGMRILDPACGSGVFLVLAFRRLIEKEMRRQGRKLSPEELRDILMESIYGVERELDACFVTEFSLVLTLLHYVEPRELHRNPHFLLPVLHNERIFHSDFFDPGASFAERDFRFDFVIGNPPWIIAKPDITHQLHAYNWIRLHKATHPVGDYRVAEAFSWRAGELMTTEGVAGLLMPATSLVNVKSRHYRRRFFSEYQVLRVTNFANLREVLFDRRGTFPANTLVYRQGGQTRPQSPIIHYGPFGVNQVSDASKRPWVLTINENEIQTIDIQHARSGDVRTWKLALWGTHRDGRVLERLRFLFPTTLEEFCRAQGWGRKMPREGAQLRNDQGEGLEYLGELNGQKRFSSDRFNSLTIRPRFSIDPVTLEDNEAFYLRRRGGRSGLEINKAPHIFLHPGWNFVVFSNEDFIINPRQMGIAAPDGTLTTRMVLKALAAYLNSSLVRYHLFFHVPQWGFFSQRDSVVTSEVRKIPVPELSLAQANELADLYDELASLERMEIEKFIGERLTSDRALLPMDTALRHSQVAEFDNSVERFSKVLSSKLQDKLDDRMRVVLDLPDDLFLLSKEFISIKLALDEPGVVSQVVSEPDSEQLLQYARKLRDELDDFTMGVKHHRVSFTQSKQLIECTVEITDQPEPIAVSREIIRLGDSELLAGIRDSLQEPISQWAYVQRGLRLFDGPRVYIYKSPRLIDWTQTQALQDADDIISTVLVSG